jgi:protein associated with RNAse G/E
MLSKTCSFFLSCLKCSLYYVLSSKYCIYDSGAHREQLIDLENDLGEMKNLAESKDFAEALNMHRELLQKWVERTGDKIAAQYIHIKS